ncbi:unnamed protein product [Phaedon cochleariae]|uniref:MADF domain-containing protein n=1 Tax=Phaedon cochleariae TaxID=80249 RepID=A0A9N9SLC1_PHACE|nr:unnamed protein product [Phaedon cochleariae]CAG9823259.1 unnamed protein product [Phaedon cochleariae]
MYDDISLIELVRQYAFLYDKAQKAYKNKTEKENTWKTISEILDTTPEECEQRWLLLRNRFCTELRKEKTIPTGSAPRTPWHLYEDLSWLKPHVIPRRTRGNVTPAPRASNVWDSLSYTQCTNDTTEDIEETENSTHDMEESETQFDLESNFCESSQAECSEEQNSHQAVCSEEQNSQPSCSTSTPTGVKRCKPQLRDIKNDVTQVKKKRGENKALGEALTGALSQFSKVMGKKEEEKKENRSNPEDHFGAVVAGLLKEVQDGRKKVALEADILKLFESYM